MTDYSTKATNFIQKLSEGYQSFSYKKADGTTRSANGTTKLSEIPESARSTVTGTLNSDPNSTTISYWDKDANDWRTCKRDSLIFNDDTEAA